MQAAPLSVTQAVISAEAAHACVGAAVKAAHSQGLAVNVAVLDASGVLAAFCACRERLCIRWKSPSIRPIPR